MAKKNKSEVEEQATRLSTLRQMLGLSQRQMAQEFNVTPGAIANWESGTRSLPGSVIRLLEIYEENLGMTDRPQNVLQKINADWASRTLRSGLTSAKLISKLAGGSMRQLVAGNERATQIKNATDHLLAQEVVTSLGELKGLMMKIGQMMVYMNFALPKNVRLLLETLQDSTTPMSKDAVNRVFLQAFGKRPDELFQVWEPYPFAAASIGQVHRAELHDGTKVAVKVQYPEITKALKSDLRNAAVIEKLSSVMFRYQDKKAFVSELTERILEECDYKIEAENTKTFYKLFENDSDIIIPKVFDDFSSTTVITTEYIQGKRFRDFLETATRDQKNKAGELLFEFTFRSIFDHGLFNCDPNGGNFLFTDTGVAFIDFGCVKQFDQDFIQNWKDFSAAVLSGNKDHAIALGKKFGHFPKPELLDTDYHFQAAQSMYEPWLHDEEYKFTTEYVETTWRKLVAENPDKYRMAMPKDWIFTNRLQWGLCGMMGELEAKSNWHRKWVQLTEFDKYKEAQDAI